MPFVPVPNTLMVEVVFEKSGEVVENTMYYERPDGWTLEVAEGFLGALRTIIQEELMPLLSTTIQLVRLVGTLLDAVDSFSVTQTVSPPFGGSDGGFALPNNVAYTVTFLTAQRGRSFRGRNYVTGMTDGDLSGPNNVDSDFRTGVLAYYDTLRAVGIPSNTIMVVVSRFSGVDSAGKPIPRAVGVTTPITGFTTFDTVLDSQRRRLPGRGL